MGFGLFLPDIGAAFRLSSSAAGVISGLGFSGFLTGLLVAYWLTARVGPKLPVLIGILTATAGMGLIAAATTVPVLTVGVILAMSSAGFTWSPFNSAVSTDVVPERRPTALSIISTGTSIGVAGAGLVALVLAGPGLSWRAGWAAFAVMGIVVGVLNWLLLDRSSGTTQARAAEPYRKLASKTAAPLYASGFSFGITTAVYISFAADRVASVGGLPGLPAGASADTIFIAYGTFGLIGLATDRLKAAVGLAGLLRSLHVTAAISHLLIAISPASWISVIISAAFQGGYVMMMSAIMAFWSERLFPEQPTRSFTATLLAVAGGSVLGPVAAGSIADASRPAVMFLSGASVSAVTAWLLRPRIIRETSA